MVSRILLHVQLRIAQNVASPVLYKTTAVLKTKNFTQELKYREEMVNIGILPTRM